MAVILFMPEILNSMWPSYAIWRHRSGSAFSQVMACSLTATGHYMNQYWLILSEILWHSPKVNFIWITQIPWWRHQIETSSALLAICAGNSPVPGEFPAHRPVTRGFDVFFDLRLDNRLGNNREAGDLRRYRAHYDVIVMMRVWILHFLSLLEAKKLI